MHTPAKVSLLAALGLFSVMACAPEEETERAAEVEDTELAEYAQSLRDRALQAGLEPLVPPAQILDPALVEVGELLFFDPILGGELDVACSTCHHPTLGFADGVDFPIGVGGHGLGPDREYRDGSDMRPTGRLRPLGRSSPTLMNLRLLIEEAEAANLEPPFLWDGRAAQLARFSEMPIRVRDEMRGDAFPQLVAMEQLLERLNALPGYVERFERLYPEVALNGIQHRHMQLALSAYQLSLVSPPSAFDRFLLGELPEDAAMLRGLDVFLSVGCVNCHTGVAFTDLQFHRTGVPLGDLSRPFQGGVDIGRQEVTGRETDRYRFRTAPLREITHTAPYMHNGTLETLESVIRFYTEGENPLGVHDPDVTLDELERGTPRPLSDAEIADLIVFLGSISSEEGELERLFAGPEQVPSGLAPSAIEAIEE